MIRLLILAVSGFLIWLLFFSSANKNQKIAISVGVLLSAIFAVWFEGYGETPKEGRIAVNELHVCGLSATHSYRSNFDLEFCLRNTSDRATVKRVALEFAAQRCTSATDCVELGRSSKEVPIEISPGESHQQTENLSFNDIDPNDGTISWVLTVASVKAVN